MEDEATTEENASPRGHEETTPDSKKPAGGRLPFKVCFNQPCVKGRSTISPSHPLGFVKGITRKFYSERETKCETEPDIEAVNRAYEAGPKQKYGYPLLESHRYGWNTNICFTDKDILVDRRLNFPKKTDKMFKIVYDKKLD